MRFLTAMSVLESLSMKYCGGYSGEDPPLPIPNREVKLTIADGTAPPGGRVGSCHFLRHPDIISGVRMFIKGGIAQLARASALQAEGRRFDSDYLHQAFPSWGGFFCNYNWFINTKNSDRCIHSLYLSLL